MSNTQRSNYFLFACLLASLVLVYFIVKPFLTALFLAAIFAFLFQPIYQKLLSWTKESTSLSALITTVLAVVLVLVPLITLGVLIFKESSGLYQSLVSLENGGVIKSIEEVIIRVNTSLPIIPTSNLDLSQYGEQILGSLVSNLGSIFSSFAKLLLNTFLFLIAFYFLLKDGKKFKDSLVELSPLADSDDRLIIKRLELSVSATVRGNLMIGLLQGILTGVGFTIFGVPNPVLWGAVAAIAALVPGLGTALVIAPGIGFLLLTGSMAPALGLLIWGIGAVGLVDNFLGPNLVGRKMQIHPLLVFLSVLGGLAFFGPLGFLLGPLAVSVCLELIDIYFSLKSKAEC